MFFVMNFYDLIFDVMNEKGITIKDLEQNGALGKNTFYLFKEASPSLISVIKIANFLGTSIDYIINQKEINNFSPYSTNQNGFFEKLENIRKANKIPQRKLCKDLRISRTNFFNWKNGTIPTMYKLIELSQYLDCDIDDLLVHVGE